MDLASTRLDFPFLNFTRLSSFFSGRRVRPLFLPRIDFVLVGESGSPSVTISRVQAREATPPCGIGI